MSRPSREQQRLGFGAYANQYERYRPGFPRAAVDWLLQPVERPARVVDVGAGTGKLTRVVAAAGHEVLAVDPDPLMLAELRRAVPGIRTATGSGESIPVGDGEVDAVLAAQAWHWMDPDAAAVELARVTRRGGVVGIAWNDGRETNARLGISDVLAAAGLSTDRSAGDWGDRDAAPGVGGSCDAGEVRTLPDPRFGPGERADFGNDAALPIEDLVALVATWSYVATHDRRRETLDQVRAALAGHADSRGLVPYPLTCVCHRFVRRD